MIDGICSVEIRMVIFPTYKGTSNRFVGNLIRNSCKHGIIGTKDNRKIFIFI